MSDKNQNKEFNFIESEYNAYKRWGFIVGESKIKNDNSSNRISSSSHQNKKLNLG